MKITDLSTPVFGGSKGGGGGATKQVTLLSITTAPSGTFEKGSQYFNSSVKLIYTAVENDTWTGATTSTPEFGVIYIFDNQGTTKYYQWDGDNLVKIGGNLTKKVYTISANNTSTLDVSSDFTKIVDVLKNGVELAITDDYTISNGVITFVTALSTTDKIIVKGD